MHLGFLNLDEMEMSVICGKKCYTMGSESHFDTKFDLKHLTEKWMFKQTHTSMRKSICK